MDILSKLLSIKKGKSKKPKKLKEYIVKKVIGIGSYGTVKEAVRIKDDVKCAIKIIKKSKLKKHENLIQRELTILKKIDHPNIIKLYDYFETHSKYYLIFELATGGELFNRICDQGTFTEKDAAIIISTTLASVAFLHSKGIVHRDIKPENLLFKDEGVDKLVLVDFGISKIIEDPSDLLTTICGSPGYTAPEILKGKKYSKPVDLWSIGVITYILLCGYSPFYYCKDTNQLLDAITHGRYNFEEKYWRHISSYAKDFIRSLLQIDPNKRATAEEALNHPWLNNLCANEVKRLKELNKTKVYNNKKVGSKSSQSNKSSKTNLNTSQPEIKINDNDISNTNATVTFQFNNKPLKTPTTSTQDTDKTKCNSILKNENMVNEPKTMTNYIKDNNLAVPQESDNDSSTIYISQKEVNTPDLLPVPISHLGESSSLSSLNSMSSMDEFIDHATKQSISKSTSDIPHMIEPMIEPIDQTSKKYTSHTSQSLPMDKVKSNSVKQKFGIGTRHMSLKNFSHKELFNYNSSSNSFIEEEEEDELPELLPDECYVANINADNVFEHELPFQSKKRRKKHKKSEHEAFYKNENNNKKENQPIEIRSKEVIIESERNLTDVTNSLNSSKEAIFSNSSQNLNKKESSSTSKLSSIVSSIIAKEQEKIMEKENLLNENEITSIDTGTNIGINTSTDNDAGNGADNGASTSTSDAKTTLSNKEILCNLGTSHIRNKSNQSINSDSTCPCCKNDNDIDDGDEKDKLPNLLESEEYKSNFLRRRFQRAVRRYNIANKMWKGHMIRSMSHSALNTSII